MFSDKLEERRIFVEKRDQLERCYQALIADYAPKGAEAQFAARLNSLLGINSELATAPILYTLRSAAEVGFSHAALRGGPQSLSGDGKIVTPKPDNTE